MKTRIDRVSAIEILDSRGNPTLEVEVTLQDGSIGTAGVPAGASTGIHEAHELRDRDPSRYQGLGVLQAVGNVNGEMARALVGKDCTDQPSVDRLLVALDGTPQRSRLGANSLIGVSLAVTRAAAVSLNLPVFQYLGGSLAHRLPCPMFNVLNGGIHANGQGADLQEFMICPVGATSFAVALRWAAEVYHHLKKVLLDRGYSVGVGDEGGFAPALKSNAEALDLIVQAIEAAGYQPGRDIALAIDPAASGFYDPKTRLYHLKSEQCSLSASELIDLYRQWIAAYPLILIEDGLAEDDWEGWKLLNTSLGNEVELVGDDLFVTNVARIERGIQQGVANAVLIKPNQVGTLTETLAAIRLAQAADWGAMVSHRSGETLDSFVADLSVGMNTGHMKAGAPCRGERLAKYNQLLRIEKFLGSDSTYAGASGFVHNRAKPSHAADT